MQNNLFTKHSHMVCITTRWSKSPIHYTSDVTRWAYTKNDEWEYITYSHSSLVARHYRLYLKKIT